MGLLQSTLLAHFDIWLADFGHLTIISTFRRTKDKKEVGNWNSNYIVNKRPLLKKKKLEYVITGLPFTLQINNQEFVLSYYLSF